MTREHLRPTNPPPQFTGWTFEPGCYVDGARGIYAIDYVVSLAEGWGFVPSNCECDWCSNPEHDGYSGCEFAYSDLADEVDEFVNARFEIVDHTWGWHDGDWGLWPIETE